MPQYLNSNVCVDESLEEYNERIYKIFTSDVELYENGHAHLVGTIKIEDPNKYIHKWDDNKSQIYPFVSFIARIEKLSEE